MAVLIKILNMEYNGKTPNLKLIWNCYTVRYAAGSYFATKYDICEQVIYK
jgi:hypothetical protein